MSLHAAVNDITAQLPPSMVALLRTPASTRKIYFDLVNDLNHPGWAKMPLIVKTCVAGYMRLIAHNGGLITIENASAKQIVQMITTEVFKLLCYYTPYVCSFEILCAIIMVKSMGGVNPLLEGNQFQPTGPTVATVDEKIARRLEAVLQSNPDELMKHVLKIYELGAINEVSAPPMEELIRPWRS